MELELQKCLKQKGYKVAAIVSGLNGLIGKDTFCFEKKYLNGKNRNEEINYKYKCGCKAVRTRL